uniref:Uncharacterized protein n=1 Tax=Nelumbo nucifera TaxID=4432 RepID=A0A822YYI7_NELNU|nr:TPA_asm: hypothetical protein HUJ06_008373 [Nelumbo nucifera]
MVSVTIVANPYKLLAALLIVTVLHCFVALRSEAQRLPDEEVRTLRQISEKLNNTYWKKLSPDSCTKKDLNRNFDSPTMLSNVTCNCSFNQSTVCHVTNIQLKSLNLTGVLPEEFGDLPYLTEIDLVLNYINGSIPVSWARIPLVTISLLGNRISGSIPEALGNIETLEELILEDNQLGGKLPPKLGNLSRLRRL